MRKRNQLLLLLATVAGVAVLGVTPVFAEDGGSGGTGSSDTATSTSDSTQPSSDATDNSGDTNPNDSGKAETEIESFRTEAKDNLEMLRKNVKERTHEARQKSCQARQASLNRRMGNFATAAQRHYDVFTGIFTKVQAFYADNKLSVSNYDALVATVNAKQTAAQQAVDALKSLDVSIDCTASDPAQQVETFKTAVAAARTALQAYRASIKDLVVAIKGVSSTQDNTSGGTQ